jgi:predicted RNA-binding protein associated with RNAse of E/G family
VDLEVDICIRPGCDAEVVDEALIERAASEGLITDKLLEVVKAKKNELMACIPEKLLDQYVQ